MSVVHFRLYCKAIIIIIIIIIICQTKYTRLYIIICIYGNSNTACDPTRALVMYYIYAYLYCVYALAGGAISIRDRISVPFHESVPTNRTLSSTGPLSAQ